MIQCAQDVHIIIHVLGDFSVRNFSLQPIIKVSFQEKLYDRILMSRIMSKYTTGDHVISHQNVLWTFQLLKMLENVRN